MTRILVTGAAGYLGSVLVPMLLDEGHEVTAVDTFAHGVPSLAGVAHKRSLAIVREDARSTATLARVREHDAVIPLAAIVGAVACDWDPITTISLNRITIEDIVEEARDDQLIVFPCTNSGYGLGGEEECTEDSLLQPLSLYGTSKVEAERAVLAHPGGISLRLATLFGVSPRMRLDLLVNDLTYRAVHDRALVLFEAGFRRNFVHVRDAAAAFLFALQHADAMKGRSHNVGDSQANMTKRDLAGLIARIVGDVTILETDNAVDPDKRDYVISNARIEALGWKPLRTLYEGIGELAKAFRAMPYRGQEWRNA